MKLLQLANKALFNSGLRIYTQLCAVIFIFFSILSIVFTQLEIIVFLNKYNNHFLDIFFQYFTFLGDGIICVLLILLFIKNSKFRLLFFTTSILILFTSTFLKQVVFPDYLRPITFFEKNLQSIHLVSGVVVFSKYSFPSGHTMVSFGLMTILASYFKSKTKASICFLIAFLVGYSRIYLFQHFLIDVLFGGFLGVLISCIILVFSDLKNEKR